MTIWRLAAWLLPVAALAALVSVALPTPAAVVFMAGVIVATATATFALRAPAPRAPVAPAPAAVRVSGADLHPLLDRFAEGVMLLDAEGMVLAANEAAARILHRPRSAMLGVSLIRASRDHELVELIRARSGETSEITVGEGQLIQVTASPVDYGDFHTVLTLRDVTALRRAERARQEMIGNVSHELRTPITAALALAETLESGVDEPEQRDRFHRQLTSEIERLGTIVDRLLRLSRIESRVEEFQFTEVDIGELLAEAQRRIAPVAERRNVRIECESPTGAPTVHADRERILEVLANLADNAIRHSPEGGVVRFRATVDGTRMRIDVKDQGPGIMPQDRSRVFERFYTADRSRGDWRGTGLGLSIARHIISRHEGDIWVADSSPGATLSFALPVTESSTAPADELPLPNIGES